MIFAVSDGMKVWQESLVLSAFQKIPLRFSDFEAGVKTQCFRDAQDVYEFLSQTRKLPVPIHEWNQNCARHKDSLVRQNILITAPFDENYPQEFYYLEDPPLFWTYEGRPLWREKPLLAVVGSREPMQDTLIWLDLHLRQFCESKEWAILSGGARGVDQRAHLIAIQTQTPTCAVLPSGLSRVYPKNLLSWRQMIIEGGGCFALKFLPNEDLQKYHFILRNRLIVALSRGVFIAEANRKSGTRMTAQWALDQHKDIAVLPVSTMSCKGLGGLDLLYETGVSPMRDCSDLKMWTSLLPKTQLPETGH